MQDAYYQLLYVHMIIQFPDLSETPPATQLTQDKREERKYQWWHWPSKMFAAARLFMGDYYSVLIKAITIISL